MMVPVLYKIVAGVMLTGYMLFGSLSGQELHKQRIINEINNSKIEIKYQDLTKIIKNKNELAKVSQGDKVINLDSLSLDELENLRDLLRRKY